jgi:NAD(P)H-hydrate epimerase
MNIPVVSELPGPVELWAAAYDIVIDAVFGFSFSGDVRPPFDGILNAIKCVRDRWVHVWN